MGFGNAAGSFMTGFMAGYKFIDDAEKKQQEIKALKDKAEAELTTEKNKFIGEQSTYTRQLQLDFQKLDEEMAKEIKDLYDPKAIMSIRNNYDDKKVALTATYNDKIGKQNIAVINTPLEQFAAKPVVYNSSKLFDVTAEDGTTFVVSNASEFGKKLENDLKNPVGQRQYIIEKGGYVLTTNAYKEKVAIDINGHTANDDVSAVRLQNINQLITKKPEAITGFSLYPQEMITPELRDRLIQSGIKPDANGNFKDLRYSTVENVNKAIINASIFEAKPMYDKTGKAVLATNKDELTDYLSKGYTTTNPSVSGADTQTFNALRDDYIKKGMPYLDASKKAFTEVYNIKGTQAIQTQTAPIIEAAKVGAKVSEGKPVSKDEALTASATVSKNLTSKQTEAISTFKENMVSYDEFKRNYKILQDGIKSGTYKSNIIANIFSQWAKAVPSGNMSIFGNPQELMDKYGIDNNLANSLANVLKIQSGLTVNEAEANRTVNFMMGGLNANEEVKAKAYKNFIDSTEFRLTQQAKNIALYDPYTAQQWLDRDKKQKTLNFKTPAAEAAFKQYGYSPFKIGNTTYIFDKFSQDIKKVGNK